MSAAEALLEQKKMIRASRRSVSNGQMSLFEAPNSILDQRSEAEELIAQDIGHNRYSLRNFSTQVARIGKFQSLQIEGSGKVVSTQTFTPLMIHTCLRSALLEKQSNKRDYPEYFFPSDFMVLRWVVGFLDAYSDEYIRRRPSRIRDMILLNPIDFTEEDIAAQKHAALQYLGSRARLSWGQLPMYLDEEGNVA